MNNLELITRLRNMTVRFGSPLRYWSDKDKATLEAANAEIARLRDASN